MKHQKDFKATKKRGRAVQEKPKKGGTHQTEALSQNPLGLPQEREFEKRGYAGGVKERAHPDVKRVTELRGIKG